MEHDVSCSGWTLNLTTRQSTALGESLQQLNNSFPQSACVAQFSVSCGLFLPSGKGITLSNHQNCLGLQGPLKLLFQIFSVTGRSRSDIMGNG